jgi:hypothetical protein
MRSSTLIDQRRRAHVKRAASGFAPGDVLFTAVAGRDRLRLYFSRVDAAWQPRQVRDALQPHHRSRVLALRGDHQSRR